MKTLEDQLARYGQLHDEIFAPISQDEITTQTTVVTGRAGRWPGFGRHPVALALVGMFAVLVVIGGIALLPERTTGSGGEFLGVIVATEPSETGLLTFRPGPVELGEDPWATHTVEVDILTDEYIQTLTLADRYVIEGDDLVPAAGAVMSEHTISDETTPGETGFVVELDALAEGDHRYALAVDVHLEPKPINTGDLEPHDQTVEVVFAYDVFRAETQLAVWCVRADQLLWYEAEFSPESFAEEGEGILTAAQVADFEAAAEAFRKEADTNLHWDPTLFFEMVEGICGVTYPERWQAYA